MILFSTKERHQDKKESRYRDTRRTAEKMRLAYIGLGSNLGARMQYLDRAVQSLQKLRGIENLRCSSVYETEPVGHTRQPEFLNAVVEVRTQFEPMQLLQALQTIESSLGRERAEHWGPRTIDLDILAVQGVVRHDGKGLQLPHPQIANRRFVLVPWAELEPDFIVPGLDQKVGQLLEKCRDPSDVRRYMTAQAWGEQMQKEIM
ncbi:2-amino-4-hydroxy-6-hydroxymethyldihydropteridine diphosphokinase [candidate division KSB1 bacterium]|nr:2-amino-4-hydroxy-6-hydroxymethyldihydropteridine diphosphokinase [candidate division KSB1 bacterium]